MNFDPNDYALDKEYRQRQESRAEVARQVHTAQENKSVKSVNIIRLVSQILVAIK